jgi:hypothetical protein
MSRTSMFKMAGFAVLGCTISLVSVGCSKEEPKDKLNSAANDMKSAAQKTGEATKDAANNAANQVNQATANHK